MFYYETKEKFLEYLDKDYIREVFLKDNLIEFALRSHSNRYLIQFETDQEAAKWYIEMKKQFGDKIHHGNAYIDNVLVSDCEYFDCFKCYKTDARLATGANLKELIHKCEDIDCEHKKLCRLSK